ncbi:MAG TPA: prolyl oligopeptidase family serine peptidase [Planctomycetota bacterium]|nr:prolyl oligopeptidase family serine peptidase [Planctomycetota bacterium]
MIRLALVAALLSLAALQEAAPVVAPESTAPAGPAPLDPALLALFDYEPDLPLEVEEASITRSDGFDRIELSYASPLGGRVPACLYVPQSEAPWAGLLIMHGMPGSHTDSFVSTLGPKYARAGALCLVISAPWARVGEGEQAEPITGTEQDRKNQIQLIVDLRRGIDLLLSFDQVQAARLGFVGGSYGGAMGGLLAGVEKRLAAYALMVGDGGLVAHRTGPDDADRPPPYPQEQWQRWLAWMEPIEPMRFVGHAAPAHLLFQNGRTDRAVPEADGLAFQAAGSEPKTCLWYPDGHGTTPERLRDQARWFAERIGIDATPFLQN